MLLVRVARRKCVAPSRQGLVLVVGFWRETVESLAH